MSKKILFILGMHRSGTSALAGAVHLCGIPGGGILIRPAFDNEKGFFENQTAVDINESILSEWGLSWDSPFNLPDHWVHDSRMQRQRAAIENFVATSLAGQQVFYLKDPRLCYLLPLWQQVLGKMGLDAQYLITLRPREEVFRSLDSRNSMGRNRAEALWLNHLLLAEKHTRGHQRLFVPYNDLLENPARQIERILQVFKLKTDGGEMARVQAFIDEKLRHQKAAPTGGGPGAPSYSSPLSDYLLALAAAPDDPAVLPQIDAIREQFFFNQAFFAPEKKQGHFATLKIHAGEQTRMVAPLKIPVHEGLTEVAFHVGHIGQPIEKLQFFPADGLCHVSLDSVKINYSDGSTDHLPDFEKQVVTEHGNQFFFGETDFLLLAPDPAKKPTAVVFGARYEHFGSAALQSLAQTGLDIKDWFYGKLKEQETAFGQQADALAGKLRAKDALLEESLERAADLVGKLRAKDALLEEALAGAEVLRSDFIEYHNGAEQKIKTLGEDLGLLAEKLRSTESTLAGLNGEAVVFKQKIGSLEQALAAAKQEADSQRAVAKQEAEGQRAALKKKDDLIWETYATGQKSERDYRQSLRILEDIKASISYRLGWALTWPLRFFYDLGSKKPVNQTSLWLAWQFLAAALKTPGRMLANINGRNIATLRKALKNESPREIAGNLMKLLTGAPRGNTAPAVAASPVVPVVAAAPRPVPPLVLPQAEKQNGHVPPRTGQPKPAVSTKKNILFASPNLPDFDGSSGGKRATRMLGLLAEDCDVYVFTLGNRPEKHIRELESLGVRVFRDGDFQAVKNLVPRLDALVFSFFYTYFDCGKFLALYPGARVIVDSVDVHWVRHERSRGLWPELTDDIIRKKKTLEIEVYQKADLVWAVTEQDRQAILDEVPGADVRIVSNVHGSEVAQYSDPGTSNLLFMGGFAHYPNIIAVRKLALDIFPKIRAQVEGARLVIAGSHAPQDVVDLGKLPGVEFLGFIDENSLSDLYQNSFLAVAPLQAGAGIKGKICEAVAHKVPVVTNAIGNEGIELVNEKSGLIADHDDELVELTVRALRREFDLGKMTRFAQQKLQDLVGPETVKKNMLESLSSGEVSICIVTWNKLGLLQRCIESIENHTHGIRYKIIVHSNGCTDGTQQYLAAAAKINPAIVPVLSDRNDVFVIPNNRMMQLFPGNDVVLLNNDTYVTEGWLRALREAAHRSEEIGVAGAKLLYPNGLLQEFGSELYPNGTGRNIGKGDDPDKEEYQQPKFVGYVSGCVFYIKRGTIHKIGVFDEAFHPCYCEDSDYCYTAWEQGLATVVTPDCVVYHDEGGTSGTDTSTGFKAYQKVNFEKFLKKHGGLLEGTATKIKLKNLALRPEMAR